MQIIKYNERSQTCLSNNYNTNNLVHYMGVGTILPSFPNFSSAFSTINNSIFGLTVRFGVGYHFGGGFTLFVLGGFTGINESLGRLNLLPFTCEVPKDFNPSPL